jgi:choline dehydrogenase
MLADGMAVRGPEGQMTTFPMFPATSGLAPGNLEGPELEKFIRDAAISYAHQASTAKMGRDAMSVVDGQLKVYGIDNLRIADASVMPRVTTSNTMAPCVVIGERAGEILKVAHGMG